MFSRSIVYVLLIVGCYSGHIYSQGLDLGGKIHRWIQDTVPEDSSEKRPAYFILVPVPRYLPETRWGLVLAGNYVFRTGSDFRKTRPSSIRLSATYTQNNQYILKPTAEIFLPDNRWMFRGGFTWMRFPELYFGRGGDTPEAWEEQYSFDMNRFFVRGMYRFSPYIYGGVLWNYEQMYKLQYPDTSIFLLQPVSGNRGGTSSGPGMVWVWDSRQNIYFPTQGVYAEVSASFYDRFSGSDFRFASLIGDFRKYFPLRKSKDVYALNVYMQFCPGDPPFRQMSMIGGENLGRGFYQGRFRDRHTLVLQQEYRLKVWKRMGMVFFGGLASVFRNSPVGEKWHPFYGLGFRGKLLRKEYLNVRLDIGIGQGMQNYYFTLDEAF